MSELTRGEFIQASQDRDYNELESMINTYMFKTYYKTASLISHSCMGVAIINGENEEVQ